MWFLVSWVNSEGLHNFVYNENMFSSTFSTSSTLVANATCVSVISPYIFSLTLLWNLFSNHSINLAFVYKSSLLTFSTMSINSSINGLVSSGVNRLNASKKLSLISCNIYFYLCSLLSILMQKHQNWILVELCFLWIGMHWRHIGESFLMIV